MTTLRKELEKTLNEIDIEREDLDRSYIRYQQLSEQRVQVLAALAILHLAIATEKTTHRR